MVGGGGEGISIERHSPPTGHCRHTLHTANIVPIDNVVEEEEEEDRVIRRRKGETSRQQKGGGGCPGCCSVGAQLVRGGGRQEDGGGDHSVVLSKKFERRGHSDSDRCSQASVPFQLKLTRHPN